MTLVLKLEHAPHRQSRMEIRFERGDLTIGRGQDADWQIEDPDMFVSRRHCVISGSDGQYTVTDASRGGLFVDGSEKPLGAGNSARLDSGTRLRLGDFVIRAELEGAAEPPRTHTPEPKDASLDTDDFFATPREVQPRPERPKNLPDPFDDRGGSDFFGSSDARPGAKPEQPPQFDDPFTLDPVPTPKAGQKDQPLSPEGFSWDEPAEPEAARADPQPQSGTDFFWDQPEPSRAEPPAAAPEPPAQTRPSAAAPGDADLRAAFYRGLGISAPGAGDPVAEMEALGARFRALVDGLQHLLRARAQEKQNARVAATVIGQQDVNPLKFTVSTDEALNSLIAHRGPGYLEPDVAITAAFRDLAEHSLKNWTGLQAALRRMIDHFDPNAIEAEMEEVGALEALLAGGRSAKLWQLYEERYQRIARAAEERFLGEVGEDFRDAYEGRDKGGRR